jgi:hypothetical protein
MTGWKEFEAQANRLDPMNSVTGKEREVIIVLSDEFVRTLPDLALEHQVWTLKTADAEKIAQEFWKKHPPLDQEAGSGGITLFTGKGDPEADFMSIVDDIELHHGIAAREGPAVTILRVFGTEASNTICDSLRALGFTRIESTPGGFLAHWHPE